MKDSVLVAFWAIAAGSGVAIATMILTGTLQTSIATLVPVGSVIIANAMNACAQAAERFRADVAEHVGQIEACSPSGHAEVAGSGVDTWCDGRNGCFWHQPGLRRDLSIHYRRHDPGCIWYYRSGSHIADAGTRFLTGRATGGGQRRLGVSATGRRENRMMREHRRCKRRLPTSIMRLWPRQERRGRNQNECRSERVIRA
jgi:Uncharacterised protein family (UPF0014)